MSNKNLFKSLWLLMLFLVVGTVSAQVSSLPTATGSGTENDPYVVKLGDGEYKTGTDFDNKYVKIIGNGSENSTLWYGTTSGYNSGREGGSEYTFEGAHVTFKDVTLKDVNGDKPGYDGFVRCNSLLFEDCTLTSMLTYLGEGSVKFENCIFNHPDGYTAWLYGSQRYEFNGCKFNVSNRVFNVYNEGAITPNIIMNGCSITGTAHNKAVFAIKGTANGCTLTISNSTCSGLLCVDSDAAVNGGVWYQMEGNHDKNNVLLDGVAININGVAQTVTEEMIPAVASTTTTVNVTTDETATEVESSTATTAVNTVVANTATVNETTTIAAESVEGVSSTKNYLHIDVKAAEVAKAEETPYVKSMTFDIKPIAATITDGKLSTEVIPNSAIKSAITFRLPVDANATETTAEVFHNGESMGSNYQVQGTTEKYIEVSTTEFSEFGYQLLDAPAATYVAQIGEVKYETLNDALAAVNSQDGDNVTLMILDDITEALTAKYEISKNLTIDSEPGKKVSCDDRNSSYGIIIVEGKTLTFTENVDMVEVGNVGAYKTSGNTIINGKVHSLYVRADGGNGNTAKLTINEKADVYDNATGTGCIRLRGNSEVLIDGCKKVNMPVTADAGGEMKFTMNDAKITSCAFSVTNNASGSIAVDLTNSDIIINANNGKFQLEGSTGSLNMVNSHISHDNASEVIIGENINVTMDADSYIKTSKFTNNGTITLSSATSNKVLMVDYDGIETMTVADYGSIIVPTGYITVVEDNDLYALFPVAQIGETKYASLAEAVAAVQNDETITLTQDITLTASVSFGDPNNKHARQYTVDFNEKTVTGKSSANVFSVYDDVTFKGPGQLNGTPQGMSAAMMKVYGDVVIDGVNMDDHGKKGGYFVYIFKDAKLTLESGTLTSDYSRYGVVYSAAGGQFVMNGGKLVNNYSDNVTSNASCVNVAVATSATAAAVATINGGEIQSAVMAVYIDGIANITEANVTAPYTVWVNKGTANISGGKFYANPTAVYLYTATSVANISGGEFWATGTNSKYLINKYDPVRDGAEANITGGIFHDFDPMSNTAEGAATDFTPDNKCTSDAEGVFTVGDCHHTVEVVGTEGKKHYDTLAAAFAAAENNATITLLTDVTIDAMQEIADGRNITLDLNGKNITGSSYFQVTHGTLDLTGTGSYTTSAVYALKAVGATTDQGADYSVITVGIDVTVKDTHSTYGYVGMISIAGNKASYGAKINFNGKGEGRLGLYVNGQVQVTTGNVPEITVGENAVVKSEEYAIYAAGYAKYNVYGTITGNGGIEAKAGALTIGENAVIEATATTQSHETNGNGTSTSGYAIASVHNEGYAGTVLNIDNGTIRGKVISIDDKNGNDYPAGIAISGGTFTEEIPVAYCAENFAPEATNGMYTVVELDDTNSALVITKTNGVKKYFTSAHDIVLEDANFAAIKAIEVKEDVEVNNLSYHRNFSETSRYTWQAWLAPFDTPVTAGGDTPLFAKIVQFAYVDAEGRVVEDTSNGGEFVLVVSTLGSGETVKANYPYFIKPRTVGLHNFSSTNNILYKTEPNAITTSTTTQQFTFNGVYEAEVLNDKYIITADGKFNYWNGANGNTLNPYRWYISVEDKDAYGSTTTAQHVSSFRIAVLGEDDLATAIVNAKTEQLDSEAIYDLFGRMIQNAQRGINIQNGKKFLKK